MTNYALCIDFGGTKVDVGIGTHDGEIVYKERLWVRNFCSASSIVAAVIDVGHRLMQNTDVQGIGVSTMGITTDNGVQLAPNVPGWSDLHLPTYFHDAFPRCSIVIENDVRAACLAEMTWGSLRGASHAAYLNLGTGIAIAFVFNGELWSGAHGAAGEIAYYYQPGEPGFSHGNAPFEEQFGGGGLNRRIHSTFPPLTSVSDLFVHLDDQRVRTFVNKVFGSIAQRVGIALMTVDVDVVSIGGGVAQQFQHIAPIFLEEWHTYIPFPPRLIPSRFLHDVGLYGALALVVRSIV